MARSNNFNIDEEKVSQFSLKRKALASSYTSVKGAKNYFNKRNSNTLNANNIINASQLDPFFGNTSDTKRAVALSNSLYNSNKIYAAILNYLSTLYYYRFTVTPRRIKGKAAVSKSDYVKFYSQMLEFVDGVNIPVVFPELLLNLFKDGQIFITVVGNSNSKTVSTMILPNEYCKPTFQTQYGTMEYKFDFTFFESLGLNEEELLTFFERFPDEFAERYVKFKTLGQDYRWQTLNPKFSACIQLNEDGFPTYLSTFYDILDYKTYKLNELDRNTNLLERLVVQEIDMEKTGLDMTEVQELHDSMADVVCQSPGSTLITTVGNVTVEQLQEEVGEKNEVLQNSFKSIFSNAGLNDAIFTGDSTTDVSLKRDLAYVWQFVQKLESFYNLALNNIKSFGPFQLSLKLLDISPYNEDDKLNQLHQSATLGVNVLDYIVATGGKQIDLEANIELEETLSLTSRLVPLQSSHTQSSTVGEGDEDGDKSKNDPVKEPGEDDESSKEDSNDEEKKEDPNSKKIKTGDGNEK